MFLDEEAQVAQRAGGRHCKPPGPGLNRTKVPMFMGFFPVPSPLGHIRIFDRRNNKLSEDIVRDGLVAEIGRQETANARNRHPKTGFSPARL